MTRVTSFVDGVHVLSDADRAVFITAVEYRQRRMWESGRFPDTVNVRVMPAAPGPHAVFQTAQVDFVARTITYP